MAGSEAMLEALQDMLQQLEAAQGGVDEEARAHLDMLRGQLGVLDQVQARHAAVAAAAEDAAPAVPTSSGGAPGAARAASSSGIGNGGMTAATSAVARDAVTMLHEMDGLSARLRGGVLAQRLSPDTKSRATCVAWVELAGEERVAVGHQSGALRVWDVDRSAVVAHHAAHRADVTALACLEEQNLLASGSVDTNIKLWGLAGGKRGGSSGTAPLQLLQVLKGHTHPITQLRLTPDGELLISGDAGGGLRVWRISGGTEARLQHDLSGQHTAAVTGIACHPEERLFATSSLDRTLRVWDMDAQAGSCIGTHGPEGRKEVHALAFSTSGNALLAAYPDCLRTFTPDPLRLEDTAELPWKQVTSIQYADGKVIGVALARGDAGLYALDVTRMRPFAPGAAATATLPGGRSSAASSTAGGSGTTSAAPSAEPSWAAVSEEERSVGGRLRFSDKYAVAVASAPDASTPSGAPASWTAPIEQPAAPGSQAAVQVALAAAERRRQGVLGPRVVNSGPAVEVLAPPLRHLHSTSTFTPVPSRPSGVPAGASAAEPLHRTPSGRASPGSGGKSSGRAAHRLSAEENGEAVTPVQLSSKVASGERGQQCAAAPAVGTHHSILDVTSLPGFLATHQRRSGEVCAALEAKRGLWHRVRDALKRSRKGGAVRLLRDAGDLCAIVNVVESGVLQRPADRFTIKFCGEALPLAGLLLASPSTRHHQAALRLVEEMLNSWGTFVSDVLSAPAHKVDLELERRRTLVKHLHSGLMALVPTLEKLAAAPLGGGSTAQLLQRIRALGG
ncbi:katanin p80 WD40 repeat-containing subunit B1-like protein isoform X1 [Micractinium conductrix]|uniref:Katanin p80 WD40 repeat-containing subunit B1-like protein isoform X1 n=1 Tax=Micractinium conductrix TaxID=554055 RepID=A0A2P6V4S5_9CHLO|nr:katanin p80 WD40 repeat-containing subunit B1-like protein isoform X1 [Micractinium conductrix]|eukprot:PSC69091.1 katanin p80 WD40 repeat-containing subunit B1-like protein isoform X1 [Micractinium conductrix]